MSAYAFYLIPAVLLVVAVVFFWPLALLIAVGFFIRWFGLWGGLLAGVVLVGGVLGYMHFNGMINWESIPGPWRQEASRQEEQAAQIGFEKPCESEGEKFATLICSEGKWVRDCNHPSLVPAYPGGELEAAPAVDLGPDPEAQARFDAYCDGAAR